MTLPTEQFEDITYWCDHPEVYTIYGLTYKNKTKIIYIM